MFAFIATHRGVWPAGWLCEALGVLRAGFYAWRTRSPSARARANEQLLTRVRSSFLASNRTYGARRAWHHLLADRVSCADIGSSGSCDRRRCVPVADGGGCRQIPRYDRRTPSRRMCSTEHSPPRRPTANGSPTSPTAGPPKASFTSRWWWISSHNGSSAGLCMRR